MQRSVWQILAAWGLMAAGGMLSAAYAAPDAAVLSAEEQRIAMIERVAASVVAIFAPTGDNGGSGVLITPDGYALSNFHVTSGCGDFMRCGLNDGRLYDAVIVGIDPTGDVALIKLLGREDFPFATLGDSDQVRVGEWVFAMGNPFLLAVDFRPTVTAGIVSGVHRYQYPAGTFLEYADCIQTDASINPGNSGGPLFNARGELVGINGRGSFEKRGRVNIGAGYAISINQIKNFLDHLKGGRIVDHATLGATVRTTFDRQVVVDQILEQSSAWRRGLREGDEIVSFAGRTIGSANQFKNVLGIYPDGWKVPLVYRRDSTKYETLVELRPLHRATEMLPGQPAGPPRPVPQRPGSPGPDEQPPKDGQPPREGEQRPGRRPESPTPEDPHHAAPKIPEQWKHLFEKKAGFANYYFNRQGQARLLASLQPFESLKSRSGRWKIAGQLADGRDFTLTLAAQGLGLKVGPKDVYFQPLDGSELLDEPPGTGGLLVAWEQLRQLLLRGPEAFSLLQYHGSEPLDGVGPLVEVLKTQVGGIESRWFFAKDQTRLVGFDTTLARDVDACEVRITAFETIDGLPFPTAFTVRSGGREFGSFRVTSLELLAPTPTP